SQGPVSRRSDADPHRFVSQRIASAAYHAFGRLPLFGGGTDEEDAAGAVAWAGADGRAVLPVLSSVADAGPVASGATSIPIRRTLWCARTLASIALKISGWSIRNCFAFSRPCPIRSPPNENQAPLFSTMLASDDRSTRSPSREIPCP